MSKTHHRRTIQFDVVTYERMKTVASRDLIPVSTWIRIAVKHQLTQEHTKSEVGQLRDELAATLTRILDHCQSLSNAQQAAIAIVDTLTKYILSVSPEPGADAQKIGRRRYEQFLKTVTTAMESDVLRKLAVVDDGEKKAN